MSGGEDGVGLGQPLCRADLPPAFRGGHEPVQKEEGWATAFGQVADRRSVGGGEGLAGRRSWCDASRCGAGAATQSAPRWNAGRLVVCLSAQCGSRTPSMMCTTPFGGEDIRGGDSRGAVDVHARATRVDAQEVALLPWARGRADPAGPRRGSSRPRRGRSGYRSAPGCRPEACRACLRAARRRPRSWVRRR